MLTEEKLPVYLSDINCANGCARAVYQTNILRDGVVIHSEYEYKDVNISDMKNDLNKIQAAVDAKVSAIEAEDIVV